MTDAPSKPSWRFAIDRGGTFTDVVATTPDGRLVTDKLLSEDPGRYDDAASEGVRRLMQEYAPDAPIAEMRVGTQSRNLASLALYRACGFAVVDTAMTLHAHLGKHA